MPFIKFRSPEEWNNATWMKKEQNGKEPEFVKELLRPMSALQGNKIPVSKFVGREEGIIPSGTSQYEKRGIAVNVPEWNSANCIQCNQCSFVCPHAAIRPFLITEEQSKDLGVEGVSALGKGLEKYQYRIQIDPLDCTGCGNCADICPGEKGEKPTMQPIDT